MNELKKYFDEKFEQMKTYCGGVQMTCDNDNALNIFASSIQSEMRYWQATLHNWEDEDKG